MLYLDACRAEPEKTWSKAGTVSGICSATPCVAVPTGATTKAVKSACKKQAGRHAVICPQVEVGCGPK